MTTRDRRPPGLTPAKAGNAGALADWENEGGSLHVPDVNARFDPHLRHLYVSPGIQRVTGRPLQDFVGKTNRDLGMPPELIEAWDAALLQVFATGRPERIELAVPTPDGTRHFDCRLVPEPGPAGIILSVLSVVRDVTDRWLAHELHEVLRVGAAGYVIERAEESETAQAVHAVSRGDIYVHPAMTRALLHQPVTTAHRRGSEVDAPTAAKESHAKPQS